MANEGHIIVKGSRKGRPRSGGDPGSTSRFFLPVDQGSAKPAFCYPQRIEDYESNVRKMERALSEGAVSPTKKMEFKYELEKKKKHLDKLKESVSNADKVISEDPDAWAKKRMELAAEIKDGMPSKTDYEKGRVNPYTLLKREKEEGFEDVKRDFSIISRALGENPDPTSLQRE